MGVCVTKTCTCVNNQVGSEDIPSLKLQKPSEDILYNGATVKIECNGIPPEIEEIQWLRYGRPLPLEHPSAVLTLSDLKTENEGAYMCEVTLKSGTKIKSDAVVLKIKDPPILELKIPPGEILIKGATVTILCQSIPKKQHKMKWFKNKKEITSTSKHAIGWLDDCPFLRLCNLESSDKGEYSCEVTHQAGFKWTSEEVMINIKDCTTEILSIRKELCFEGATLVIKCRPPIPHPNEVIWYKNNTEIVKKGRISEGTSEDPSICISKLTQHDAGIYKCRISYDFGWIEGSLKVDVEVQETEKKHANEFLDAKKSGVSGIMGTVSDFVSNLTPGKMYDAAATGVKMYMVQRTCMLSLENDSDFTLINPQMYEKETNSKPETICKGEDIVLKYTTEGTKFDKNLSGVLTYEVAENGENIAIFWGVWFKEDNQFNVEITRLDADQGLHDKLMETAKTAVIETVQENGNGYTVTATMSNETKAHLRVVIANKRRG